MFDLRPVELLHKSYSTIKKKKRQANPTKRRQVTNPCNDDAHREEIARNKAIAAIVGASVKNEQRFMFDEVAMSSARLPPSKCHEAVENEKMSRSRSP
ncbi:hypothetical protein L484_019877 [Morus notabilis]|uniref:Uncharacterized protein n=1 Tax=Morus notabilis TaxID=981085 RepID=W9SK99_9ROSA|nr:hypothetical protein L484_019877 [Morus notabilis]